MLITAFTQLLMCIIPSSLCALVIGAGPGGWAQGLGERWQGGQLAHGAVKQMALRPLMPCFQLSPQGLWWWLCASTETPLGCRLDQRGAFMRPSTNTKSCHLHAHVSLSKFQHLASRMSLCPRDGKRLHPWVHKVNLKIRLHVQERAKSDGTPVLYMWSLCSQRNAMYSAHATSEVALQGTHI